MNLNPLTWFNKSPAQELKAVRRGEVSFRDSELYTTGQFFPYNPDVFVQRKGGMRIYDKMRRDDMVKSSQYLKKLAVLCSGWAIDPVSEEPADMEVADFVTAALIAMPGTLEEKLKEILTGMDYGYSVTEKVYRYNLLEKSEFSGKLAILLKTRKPQGWDFDTDPYGNLNPMGLWQNNGAYKYNPHKFVVYSHNKEFDNWYGTSDLQSAYRPWWSKDVLIKLWNVYLERYGQGGIPMLHGKEGKEVNPNIYETLKTALANIQNKSVLSWSDDSAMIELLELSGKGTGEHEKAVRYNDRAIGRALLMPTGLGFSEDDKSGSKARSQTHLDLWVWVMTDLRRIVAESIVQEQILKDLVDLNYIVEKYPTFRFNPLDDAETAALAALWLKAVSGKAVHPNADDEQHFRKMLEFPEREQTELEEEFVADKARSEEMHDNKMKPPVALVPGAVDPAKKTDVIPIDPKKKKEPELRVAAKTWFRALSPFELRVDFAGVEKALDSLETDATERLVDILTKQRDKFLGSLSRKGDEVDFAWINSIQLQNGVEFYSTMKEFFRTAFEVGRKDAASEISLAREKQLASEYVIKLPPIGTIKQLEKLAFWIKGVVFDGVLKGIQSVLLAGIEGGETPGDMALNVRAVYDPYIGDKQIVIDQRQIEPYRIETLVRTNTTRAYNKGKMVEFVDPDLDGFVRAYELSAILDLRTTEICRAADGKIVMLEDDSNAKRMVPPLHFNCRTVVVPVTEADDAFEPAKQAEIARIEGLMPKEFGGDADK